MTPAATFSHTFTEEPVKYPYYFLLHPNMVGTVSNSFSGKNIAMQSGHTKDVFCSYRMEKAGRGSNSLNRSEGRTQLLHKHLEHNLVSQLINAMQIS
jgi:hypothetical protein